MNAPEDPNGLREALAGDYVLVKRGLYYRPDSMGYTGVLDDAGRYTAEEARFHNDHCSEVKGILASEAPRFSRACWPEIVTRTLTNDLRAAEAEITRLKEGMEALGAALKPFAAGADIADAIGEQGGGHVQDNDDAWVSGNDKGSSYPLFKFGDLRAARDALATLSPKEHPHG